MSPENYINPHDGNAHPEGELAAFALNALDDAEFQAVFHHVIQCLHCQEVLLGFQEASARLTGAAPEVPLPRGLKDRVLATAAGRESSDMAVMPPADSRWSMRRLRRWLMPAAVGALSLLLAVSIGVITLQQREINQLTAAAATIEPSAVTVAAAPGSASAERIAVAASVAQNPADSESADVVGAAAPGRSELPLFVSSGASSENSRDLSFTAAGEGLLAGRAETGAAVADAETVGRMREEMAEVVEATVLSAQPETEKVSMSSPMGTEPEARGVLMVEPSGRRGVLMVSGMPADTYQIWLVRGGHQVMVDRVVVNDDDGAGVKQLDLDESIFQFQQVALLPDERHGPTNPTGEQFLSALIVQGPPMPPR